MPNAAWIYILVAYLLGSVPSAYVAGQLRGIDITQHGSGNVGGTNAFRVLGLGPAIGVALFDVGKAVIPAYLATKAFATSPWVVVGIALAPILGHNYSVFLGFKGGKGIATSIGVSLVLFPKQILLLLIPAVLIVLFTRYVSVASITLVSALPLVLAWQKAPLPQLSFSLLIAALGVWRHRTNIGRLLRGEENRISFKKTAA